ncbi:hypothetical protein AX14_007940 [Amanita brunnescens Koide BX004]|nr:hypothetical protein AX14_007940 [Amanita brunnescens Koide BX004]
MPVEGKPQTDSLSMWVQLLKRGPENLRPPSLGSRRQKSGGRPVTLPLRRIWNRACTQALPLRNYMDDYGSFILITAIWRTVPATVVARRRWSLWLYTIESFSWTVVTYSNYAKLPAPVTRPSVVVIHSFGSIVSEAATAQVAACASTYGLAVPLASACALGMFRNRTFCGITRRHVSFGGEISEGLGLVFPQNLMSDLFWDPFASAHRLGQHSYSPLEGPFELSAYLDLLILSNPHVL